MVTHLYGILGVILDRTFGNIIRMLRVIRLPKDERGQLSWTFVGTLAVILAYGLIMMFSASYSSGYTNHGGNIYYFIKPQAIVAAVGFVVMLGVSLINYRALRYMFWTFYVITLALLVLALFLIFYVLYKGVPHLSWQLLSTKPSYLSDTIGILPDIISTVCMVLTTLVVVLPVGVCAAVYLTEYARNRRLAAAIEYTAETLSGIPSIIYGLVGQMFFCQFLGMKKSLIAGAMTLVIMNLPTIMRTTQESLKTVPQSYREGALGLGAGKWRTIRTVVLPGCVDGVLTGCILAVGRILGETAALLYTAGFAHALYGSLGETLNNAGATLSVALYVYAKEQGEFDVAFAIAAILMALALLIDLAASLTGRYFKKRRSL